MADRFARPARWFLATLVCASLAPHGVTAAGPPAAAPPPPIRSRQLELAARQADRHSRRAFELAGRRAYFAARAEFVRGLRVLAQALDSEHGTNRHSQALAAGLRAVDEASDFVPPGSQLEADLDVPQIVRTHRTPVLAATDTGQVTPSEALRTYLTYAQEQLSVAVHREVAGSMALHGLGKLHTALAKEPGRRIVAAPAKAMAFFQAALLANPRNHMAAHELGVLLAQNDQYQEARAVLEYCLTLHQAPVTWHNLAVVYHRMGDAERARRAETLAQQLAQRPQASLPARQPGPVDLRWVPPSVFSQSGPAPSAYPPAPVRPPGADTPRTADRPFWSSWFGH